MENSPKTAEILQARAQELAREVVPETIATDSLQVLEFTLADEHYGIEVEYVSEVQSICPFTLLPGTPDFLLGIVNLKGRILSLIDIKKWFNLPEAGFNDLNKIIFVTDGEIEFGILAETVLGDTLVSQKTLQKALPNHQGVFAEYLQGVARDCLIILDLKKIFGDEKIIIQGE